MSFSINSHLPFAVSVSAYYLQKLSDIEWINSSILSTKISQISSIRHYRASIMMSNELFYKNTIQLEINDLTNVNQKDLINIFFSNEKTIFEAMSLIQLYHHDKLIKDYMRMFNFTMYCIIKLMKVHSPLFNKINDDYIYSTFMCLQCGKIYGNDVIKCEFCGAGQNLINSFPDIL